MLKNSLNSTKDITTSYAKLEEAYKDLSDRYSHRIEQSQEIAEHIAKDIYELTYHFKSSTTD